MTHPPRAQLAVVFGISLIVFLSISGALRMPSPSPALAQPVAAAATPTSMGVATPTLRGTTPPPPTRPAPPTRPPRPTPTPLGPPQAFLAVADATVRAGADATTNFGADATLVIKDGSDDFDRRSFLRFDLRSLAATQVHRAILMLYVADLPNGSPAPFRTAAIADDSWNEATLTWNTQPVLGASGMQYNVTTTGWFSLDLLGYVNTQLATDKQVSLALFDESVARLMIRASSREGAHPPVLEITR